MKKTLALLLALIMAFSMFSVMAFAQSTATMNVTIVDDEGKVVNQIKAGESVWAVISVDNYEDYVGEADVDYSADDVVVAADIDRAISVVTAYLEFDATVFSATTDSNGLVWDSPYKDAIAGQSGALEYNMDGNYLKTLLRTDGVLGGVNYSITKTELDANNGELFRIKLTAAADAKVGEYSVGLYGGDGVTLPGIATTSTAAGDATVVSADVDTVMGAAAALNIYSDDVVVELPDSYTIVDDSLGFDYDAWTAVMNGGTATPAEDADNGSYKISGTYSYQSGKLVYNDAYHFDGVDVSFSGTVKMVRYNNNNLRQDAPATYGGVALGDLEFRMEEHVVPQLWYNGEKIAQGEALIPTYYVMVDGEWATDEEGNKIVATDEEGNPIYADWAAYIEAVKFGLIGHNDFAFTYNIEVKDGVVTGTLTYKNASNNIVTSDALVTAALPEGAFAEAVKPAVITAGTYAYVDAYFTGAKLVAEKAITDVAKDPVFAANTFSSDLWTVSGTIISTDTAYGDFIKLQKGAISATTKKAYSLGNEFHAGVKTLRQSYNRFNGDYSALTVGDLTVKVVTVYDGETKFNTGAGETDVIEVYVADELVATSDPITVKGDSAAYTAAGVNSAHTVGYAIAIDYVDGVVTVNVNGTVLTVEAELNLNGVTMSASVKTNDWSNSITYMPYLYQQKVFKKVDLGMTNAYVGAYVVNSYDNVPSYVTTAANVGDNLSADQLAILTQANIDKAKEIVVKANAYANLGDITLSSYLVYGFTSDDWTATSGSLKLADYGTYVQGTNATDIKVSTKKSFDLSKGFELGVGYGKINYNTKEGYNATIKIGDIAIKVEPANLTANFSGASLVTVSNGDTVLGSANGGNYSDTSDFKSAVGSAVTADRFVNIVVAYDGSVLTVTVNKVVAFEGAVDADLSNATVSIIESKLTGWASSFAYDFYLTAGEEVIDLFELNEQMGTLADVIDYSKYSEIAALADTVLPQLGDDKLSAMNNIAVYEEYKAKYAFIAKGITYTLINGFYASEWTDVKTNGGFLVRGEKEIAYTAENSEIAYKTISYPNTALYMENVRAHQTMTSKNALYTSGYFKITHKVGGSIYNDRYVQWTVGDLAIRITCDSLNSSPEVDTGVNNATVFEIIYKGEVIKTITGEANDLGYDKSVDPCSTWMFGNCKFTFIYNNGNIKIMFYNGADKYVTAKDGFDLTTLEAWDGEYDPNGQKVSLDVYTSYSQCVVQNVTVSGKVNFDTVDYIEALAETDPASGKLIYDTLSDKTVISADAAALLNAEFVVSADEGIDYTYTVVGAGADVTEYRIGDTIKLVATGSDELGFGGWFDADGNLLSTNKEYDVVVAPGTTVVAKGCVHEAGETVGAKDATCGADGYTGDVLCSICGCVMTEGEVTPATGLHEETTVTGAKDATCGAAGYTGDTVCVACGKTIETGSEIPATGEHAWGEFVPNEDGLTETKTCGTCGATETQDIVVEECAHEWGDWEITTEATSTTAGVKTRVCGLCGAEETMEYTVATSGTSGDTTWRLENGTLYIEGAGAMGNYVNVGDVAPWKEFYREITAVVIGDEVTYIGNRAFKGLNKVTTVTIGSAVATTGYECFYGCTSLVNVEIKTDVLTTIGALCFYNCAFESIEIPETVTTLANRAFKNCKNLTAVEIPNAVTSTGYEVFMGCAALETVEISTGLNMINPLVFQDCTSLKEVFVPQNIIRVRNSAFAGCTALEVVDFENDDNLYASTSGDPAIASNAFANCPNLTIKGWMNGTANDYAVQKSITFVANNTSVFKYTLDENNQATITGMRGTGTAAVIPETVDGYTVIAIGNAAFRDNTRLTRVTIPATVKTIGGRAFQGCTALTTVTGLENVTTVQYNAFTNCALTGELYVPSTVAIANATVFQGCTDVVIKTQAGSTAAKYAAGAVKIVTNFDYTVNEDGESVTVTGVIGDVTELVIPDEINGYKVTVIAQRAFKNNTTLTSVVIGNNVENIMYEAFMNCTNVTTVTVGTGLTATGASTFGGMTALESITIASESVVFHNNTFLNTPTTATIYGVAGTSVQTIATNKGFTFVAL